MAARRGWQASALQVGAVVVSAPYRIDRALRALDGDVHGYVTVTCTVT